MGDGGARGEAEQALGPLHKGPYVTSRASEGHSSKNRLRERLLWRQAVQEEETRQQAARRPPERAGLARNSRADGREQVPGGRCVCRPSSRVREGQGEALGAGRDHVRESMWPPKGLPFLGAE